MTICDNYRSCGAGFNLAASFQDAPINAHHHRQAGPAPDGKPGGTPADFCITGQNVDFHAVPTLPVCWIFRLGLEITWYHLCCPVSTTTATDGTGRRRTGNKPYVTHLPLPLTGGGKNSHLPRYIRHGMADGRGKLLRQFTLQCSFSLAQRDQ